MSSYILLFVWIALLVKMELVRPVDSSLTNIIQNEIDNKFYVFLVLSYLYSKQPICWLTTQEWFSIV